MKYCVKCVQPDTRPGIELNGDGVCNACIASLEKKQAIDWDKRRAEFEGIIEKCRREKKGNYDCLIPVSGGKDSTYQVYMAKHIYKLNPLCVTVRSPARTEIGQANLDNLIRMGVDHIDFSINVDVEKKFIYQSLVRAGTVSLPFHMALFSVPLRFAVKFQIPLIIWGESTQMEYGGSATDRKNPYLDLDWVKKYGCCGGTVAGDWVGAELSTAEMHPFSYPADDEIKGAKIQSIFLGYYFKWDPVENHKIAQGLGFKSRAEGPAMGLYEFSDVDCDFILIHHHIKWLKFGMTRLFDNISVEIRNGRMTREEGIRLIRKTPVEPPGKQIRLLCGFLGIPESRFWEILETHRDKKIWQKDAQGNWHMPEYLKGL